MTLEPIRTWYWSLGKLESILALLIVTISCLLIFRLPLIGHFHNIYFNETLQYLLILIVCGTINLIVKPPTISYFGIPKFSWTGLLIVVLAIGSVALDMSSGFVIHQPIRVKIAGIISLLAIGFAEEMLSRILVFGTLQRFGKTFAVLASSIIFGLMHLNVYLPYWDSWSAYWHVMNTTGWAFFVCALLISTRSYWLVALFHAFSDWTVIFDKVDAAGGGGGGSIGVLEGLRYGIEELLLPLGVVGLIFLFVLRGRMPRFIVRISHKIGLVKLRRFSQRLALRFKLVEE